MRRVLCFLTVNPEYNEFAIPELKALLAGCGVPLGVLLEEEDLQPGLEGH
jgi:hypothetical protein